MSALRVQILKDQQTQEREIETKVAVAQSNLLIANSSSLSFINLQAFIEKGQYTVVPNVQELGEDYETLSKLYTIQIRRNEMTVVDMREDWAIKDIVELSSGILGHIDLQYGLICEYLVSNTLTWF